MEKDIWDSWVEKEKKIESDGKRKYLHFDSKINFSSKIDWFLKFFNKSENIVKHSFYPFIQSKIKEKKYKRIDGSAKRKKTIKERPIAYASHFDSFIYSYYSSLLSIRYEKFINKLELNKSVLAYRPLGLNNIDFAHEVFNAIKERDDCSVITVDIKSFYDYIDHDILKRNWCRILDMEKLPNDHYKIYKNITNYRYVEKEQLLEEFNFDFKKNRPKHNRFCTPLEFRERIRNKKLILANPFQNNIADSERHGAMCGIPQGSPISSMLSNIFMLTLDTLIIDFIKKKNSLYRRYSDDILIICPNSKKDLIFDFLKNAVKSVNLNLNNQKTEIIDFRLDHKEKLRGFSPIEPSKYKNLQYLGFDFNGSNIYLRSSSISKYYIRLKARIRENIKSAYGNKSIGNKIHKKKLFARYTDKGKRNFITYGYRASKIMETDTIENQIKGSTSKVKTILVRKRKKYEAKLKRKNKLKKQLVD